MKTRKLTDFIKLLTKLQNTYGDAYIKIDANSMENAAGGDYSHTDFDISVETINEIDDNGSNIIGTMNVVVIKDSGGEV